MIYKDTWNDNIKSINYLQRLERPLYHERKTRHLESDVLKVILCLGYDTCSLCFDWQWYGLVVLIYVSAMYATTSVGLYCMDIAFVLGDFGNTIDVSSCLA